MSNLLIVDDEESICWGLSKIVERLGHTPITKSSAEAALTLEGNACPAAIVLDVRLPGISGLEAMEQLRERFGEVPIIIITAHGDLETAVSSVRHGAFEYVVKPFETEEIRQLILRALEANRTSTTAELAHFDGNQSKAIDGNGMVGESRVMQDVFARVALAANSDAGVLVQGESGTGKELVARALHRYGPRANGPFVAVNLAALSSSVAESELFGHVRGAFTGAATDRDGLLKQANGGTLFIDEVGDIPSEMQVKLLRVLEHGVFTPVGGTRPVESDFRIVSATNADLLDAIKNRRFRHDLFYRLAAFQIELPPLRERDHDAVLLAKRFASSLSDGRQSISRDAELEILQRAWDGNVRELRNAIEHALVLARGGPIQARHLPEPLGLSESELPDSDHADLNAAICGWIETQMKAGDRADELYATIMSMIERPLFQATLDRHGGNFSAAAKDLGIHRTTLRKKMSD